MSEHRECKCGCGERVNSRRAEWLPGHQKRGAGARVETWGHPPTITDDAVALRWYLDRAALYAKEIGIKERGFTALAQDAFTSTPNPRVHRELHYSGVPRAMRDAMLTRDLHQCRRCGATEDLEADHVKPRALGGRTTLANLQTLCKSCNCSKGARLDW